MAGDAFAGDVVAQLDHFCFGRPNEGIRGWLVAARAHHDVAIVAHRKRYRRVFEVTHRTAADTSSALVSFQRAEVLYVAIPGGIPAGVTKHQRMTSPNEDGADIVCPFHLPDSIERVHEALHPLPPDGSVPETSSGTPSSQIIPA